MSSAREARRERNRLDFIRATTQGLHDAGHHKHAESGTAGVNAGNTYREHLEDEIRKSVRVYKRIEAAAVAVDPVNNPTDPPVDSWGPQGIEHRRKAARGVIRGLCKALLMYEDSYDKDNVDRLKKMEREFLND